MSANVSQFPTLSGALVPRDPADPPDRLAQERNEERIQAPRLLKFLNRTLDAIADLDKNENLKIHNEMVRCVAYCDGRWDGSVRNGEWVDNPVVMGEIQPKDNEYKRQIEKLLMEMARGGIEYHSEATNKFSAAHREAAQFVQRRIEINQDRIETEPFVQAENGSLLLKTICFRYTFFDKNANSQEKSIELQVMKHLTDGASVTVCRTCGMTADPMKPMADRGPMTDDRQTDYQATKIAAQNCPNCGDTETRTVSSPQSEGMEIQQVKKPAGRVVTVRPDATMVQLDLNARDIQSSSFIRWRLVLRRCDWESMFPNTKIPSSSESTESRHRSESQNQASQSGWTVSTDDPGGGQFEKIEGELVWLDPKVYQRYPNKETETLGNGQELPAGTMLIDQFSSGVCVARIGQKILDLYPSNKNICWTMCVYGLREHALHGSGTTALLGPQDIINEENAMILASHVYGAAGRELLRTGAIEGGQFPALNQVAYIDAPPEVTNLAEWATGRVQPNPLNGDVYAFRQAMEGSLQDAAGTSSLSMQGAADVKQLGTATGVEASRDQAVGRMIPNRKLQAYMGTEWIKQVLELERENYTADVFLEMAGKCDEKGEIEYTERGVRTFFNCDVRTDFLIKPVPGSWMPTTPAQDRANAAGFAQAAQLVQGNPQMMSLLAPAFGQDYSVDEWGAAQRNASMRLEEMARVSEIVAGGGYSASPEIVQVVLMNIAEWARVNPQMDKHEAFRNFYQDWWLSDEGRNASSLLRSVVETVYRLHLNKGIVAQAQEQGAATIAAQAPQQAVQEQLVAQQQQQSAAQVEQSNAQSKQDMIEQALGQQALTERDREHQAQTDVAKKQSEAEIQARLKNQEAQNQADLITHKALTELATKPHETSAQMDLKEHSALVDAAVRPEPGDVNQSGAS